MSSMGSCRDGYGRCTSSAEIRWFWIRGTDTDSLSGVCVFVVESVRYYYLAVSHYTARVYCTSWHEAMRRTPPTLARVSSESPANLAGVSSESLTTLARVSSARSRSPCKHGDCSLLLPSGEPLAIRHTSVQHSRTGQGGWVSILQVPSCLPPARRRHDHPAGSHEQVLPPHPRRTPDF